MELKPEIQQFNILIRRCSERVFDAQTQMQARLASRVNAAGKLRLQ